MITIKEETDLDRIVMKQIVGNLAAFAKRHQGMMGIVKGVGISIEKEKAREAKRKAKRIIISIIAMIIFIISIVGINISNGLQ